MKNIKANQFGFPKDWRVMPLADLSVISRLAGAEYTSFWQEDTAGEILALRGFNIGKGKILEKDLVRISNALSMKLKRSRLCAGDVVYPCVGSIGNAAVIRENNKYHIQQNIARISPNQKTLDPDFLANILMSFLGEREVARFNSSSSQPSVLVGNLRQYNIPVPPISEQKLIASRLSSFEQLIDELDKLIAKKRDIKLATMQQLLTGKTRLPGFSGSWIECTWGDLIKDCTSGATPFRGNTSFYKGNIRWITSGELNFNFILDTLEHISEEAVRKTNLKIHPSGTFLMAITGLEAAGTRGACAIVGLPSTTNQSCMAIYPNEKLKTKYLYHFYRLFGNELALKYCQGTKQQSYTAGIVRKLPIKIPIDTAEQSAIADIFDLMDSELECLENKHEKLKLLKQGMMQELLTGRIRLI